MSPSAHARIWYDPQIIHHEIWIWERNMSVSDMIINAFKITIWIYEELYQMIPSAHVRICESAGFFSFLSQSVVP